MCDVTRTSSKLLRWRFQVSCTRCASRNASVGKHALASKNASCLLCTATAMCMYLYRYNRSQQPTTSHVCAGFAVGNRTSLRASGSHSLQSLHRRRSSLVCATKRTESCSKNEPTLPQAAADQWHPPKTQGHKCALRRGRPAAKVTALENPIVTATGQSASRYAAAAAYPGPQ